MSDVFQEVDEDIRLQELQAFWRRFGPMAVGAAVLAIALSAGYIFWQNQKEAALAAAGDQLIAGVEQILAGDSAGAVATFSALVENAPGGYATIGRFQQAAAYRMGGQFNEALAIYDALSAETSMESDYRDLARLFAGYITVEGSEFGYADIESRLASVGSGTGPWRYHALEVLGFGAMLENDFDTAKDHYRQITDDGLAPEGVAARANEMLNMIDAAAR